MVNKTNLNWRGARNVSVLSFLLLAGCAAPYKIMPEFESHKDQIKTIAMYPLSYSDKGEEQHKFGTVFSEAFFDSVKTTSLVKPVDFILPDSTVSLLSKASVSAIVDTNVIQSVPDTLEHFPVYKPPTSDEMRQISETVDGLLYCDLKLYNEVGFGKQMGEAMITACLTLGTVSVFEKSIVQMDISLVETKTGKSIWTYTPKIEISTAKWSLFPKPNLVSCFFGGLFGPESKSLEEQRNEMAKKIIKGFRKGFPFSRVAQTQTQ